MIARKVTGLIIITLLLSTAGAVAQTSQAAATQGAVEVTATVLEVSGIVDHAPPGQEPQQVKKGDVLHAPTEIRTGPKSAVLIKLHTTAIIEIRAFTRVAITELTRLGDTERTRLFLSRGKIRAGILEEKARSDFQIACPAAVLSREGTWGIEMEYDPATGKYRVGLDTEGLVRVIDRATGRRVGVRPGEYITQAMQRWFRTAAFDRVVTLVDQFGITHIEELFYANNPGGLTALDPTGNRAVQRAIQLTAAQLMPRQAWIRAREQMRQAPLQAIPLLFRPRPGPGINEPQNVPYRFGNFGTHIREGGSQTSLFLDLLPKPSAKK